MIWTSTDVEVTRTPNGSPGKTGNPRIKVEFSTPKKVTKAVNPH